MFQDANIAETFRVKKSQRVNSEFHNKEGSLLFLGLICLQTK